MIGLHPPPRIRATMPKALWTALALLAACAPDDTAPRSASSSAAAPTDPSRSIGFDGVYEGTYTPDSVTDCGFPGPIAFQVAGSRIWFPNGDAAPTVAGQIDPDGRLTMTNVAGDHAISGTIRGGHLVATEISPPHHHKHASSVAPPAACQAEIDARRLPSAAG